MILRLRVFDLKKKSGIAPTQGMAPRRKSTPILPPIRARCHLGIPRLRASHAIQLPIAAAIRLPPTGITSKMTSRPNWRFVPGKVNIRSSNFSIASIRRRTDAGSRSSERRVATVSNGSCGLGIVVYSCGY